MWEYVIFFGTTSAVIVYQYLSLRKAQRELKTAEQRRIMHFLSTSRNLKQ